MDYQIIKTRLKGLKGLELNKKRHKIIKRNSLNVKKAHNKMHLKSFN